MPTKFMHRCVRSLTCAAGLLGLVGLGCSSEESAAVGTIEMGKADKNNLMSFGGGEGGDAAPADAGSGGKGRGRGGRADSGGFVKSIKGGAGGGATP